MCQKIIVFFFHVLVSGQTDSPKKQARCIVVAFGWSMLIPIQDLIISFQLLAEG
jgi:hypothetical protein